MVYPTFPDPDSTTQEILPCLPHARAAHKLLDETGILNDTAVGPELSFLIARAMERLFRFEPQASETPDFWIAVKYYVQGHKGYQRACKRAESSPSMRWKEILPSTVTEYETQYPFKSTPDGGRFAYRDARLSRNPHWRCVDAGAEVGMLFLRAGQADLSVRWLKVAVSWYDTVFGPSHFATYEMIGSLQEAYELREDYKTAIELNEKRFKNFFSWAGTQTTSLLTAATLTASTPTVPMSTIWCVSVVARILGRLCLKVPGREEEGVKWLELSVRTHLKLWDGLHRKCGNAMIELAYAHQKHGSNEAYIYWHTKATEVSLNNPKEENFYDDRPWTSRDPDYQYAVDLIRAMRQLVSDNVEMPVELESFVRQVDSRARRWEALLEKAETEAKSRKEQEDAEFDE